MDALKFRQLQSSHFASYKNILILYSIFNRKTNHVQMQNHKLPDSLSFV